MEVVPCKCLSINSGCSSWLCRHVEHEIREISLVQHAIFVHSTHTDLCIVFFVYEINKGQERVSIKLVVHFDYSILLVYSACLLTWVRETLSYQANTSGIDEGRLSLARDQAAARIYSRSEKLPRDIGFCTDDLFFSFLASSLHWFQSQPLYIFKTVLQFIFLSDFVFVLFIYICFFQIIYRVGVFFQLNPPLIFSTFIFGPYSFYFIFKNYYFN